MKKLTAFLNALPADVRESLENELESAGVKLVWKTAAHQLVKAVDTAVAIGVKHLRPEQVTEFGDAFDDTVWEELSELGQAVAVYIPLQADVELMKRQHGDKSPEANAARKRRSVGLNGFREEIKDTVLAFAGKEPTD